MNGFMYSNPRVCQNFGMDHTRLVSQVLGTDVGLFKKEAFFHDSTCERLVKDFQRERHGITSGDAFKAGAVGGWNDIPLLGCSKVDITVFSA
jgi:hypothetical protein